MDFGVGTQRGRDWEGMGTDLDGGWDNTPLSLGVFLFSPSLVSWRIAILLFDILLSGILLCWPVFA